MNSSSITTQPTETETLQEPQPNTIMSICTNASRIGCAIYRDSTINLIADRKDSADPYKGLDLLIQRIDPTYVLVSSVQAKLIRFITKRFKFKTTDIAIKLKKEKSTQPISQAASYTNYSRRRIDSISSSVTTNASSSVSDPSLQYPLISDDSFHLILAHNGWFSLQTGFQKMLDSELMASKNFMSPDERMLNLLARVNKSTDVCAIRAVAAISCFLTYEAAFKNPTATASLRTTSQVSSQYAPNEIDESISLMPIVNIQYMDPGPILSMDKYTLESLNIFDGSYSLKAKVVQEITNDNKLLSLYDFLNQCVSVQGKRQLRTILMWPLQDLNQIIDRLDTIDFFMDNENKLFKENIISHLKSITPLEGLFTKLNQTIGTHREVFTLYKVLWSLMSIVDLSEEYQSPTHPSIFRSLKKMDNEDLRTIVNSIVNIINFEESKRAKRIQVNFGVDTELDTHKETIASLPVLLDEVSVEESNEHTDFLDGRHCHVLYLPRIGFLNSVEYTSLSDLSNICANPNFEILMHTESSVYFKTNRMDRLDREVGDVACNLIDKQEGVVMDLQSNILKHLETILNLVECCGYLDCLISFANISQQQAFTRPEFVEDGGIIDVKQAYHPLHANISNFVSNDVDFIKMGSMNEAKVMVLTGPNSCGKTTYMKSACLVVYMAHLGCFVPAIYAKLPLVDAIITKMHSPHSISTCISSFATDLQQISYSLDKATSKTLIAIDEFGKGTGVEDGCALLISVIVYLAKRGINSPYTMVSTHFRGLISYLETYSSNILYKTFSFSKNNSNGQVIYNYKLTDGIEETSLADQVAEKAGVPRSIIERAKEIRESLTKGMPILAKAPPGA